MSKKRINVISGFPGVGKTYASKKFSKISDSDSSKFDKTEFPNNYVNHIEKLLENEDFDLILISSHNTVLEEMLKRNIDFVLVYPNKNLKNEYLDRYKKRGSDINFINLLDSKWDDFHNNLAGFKKRCRYIELQETEFLSDILYLSTYVTI